jgi:L-asparagine transporter-like permease
MMPIILPMPVSDGPSGPWTAGHTQFVIALTIALAIAWIISLMANWMYTKRTTQPESLLRLMIPMESYQEWASTAFLGMILFILVGLEIITLLTIGIIHILF